MKRNTMYTLSDCLKANDGAERSNREWMEIVANLLMEFYEDKYPNGEEFIYDCSDKDDVHCLMALYDVKSAINLVVSSKYGYVIAGYNLAPSKCIIINEDNFWEVLNQFWDQIDERIEYYFENEKFNWEDIQRYYPTLDVKRYLFGNERFIVRTRETNAVKDTTEYVSFDTRENAEAWIYSQLKTLMDGTTAFRIIVSAEEGIFKFNYNNGKTIEFNFIDYTDRELTK